jgi:FlaA1/EpsC-like NDP-sugar epimerase
MIRYRFLIHLLGGGLVCWISLLVAYALRYDFAIPHYAWSDWMVLWLWFIPFKLLVLSLFRQLDALPSYFGWSDVQRICAAMLCSAAVLLILYYASGGMSVFAPPRSVALIDAVLSASGLFVFRFALNRLTSGGNEFVGDARKLVPAAVMGAGEMGALFVSGLRHRNTMGLHPVCYLDDDAGKHGGYLHNLPILGGPELIPDLVDRYGIQRVVIAIRSTASERIRDIVRLAGQAGCRVEFVPDMARSGGDFSHITALRKVRIEDVLGRDEVSLAEDSIRALLHGKTVCITGAGGSIGSEIARQVAAWHPARLVLIERSEFALYSVEQALLTSHPQLRVDCHLRDLRDGPRLQEILAQQPVDILFHAAAHKHVPIAEREPDEVWLNNTLASVQLIRAADAAGVTRLVFISTDKAVDPVNVLGKSKRTVECFIQAFQPATQTRLSAVRFGNVLGSSGSVIPLFQQQIERGGPVTVTHPDATRYFMTVDEAVGLVLQCATMGEGGDIFVLNMGQPVRILDLARQMIQLAGFRPEIDIPIVITGLRPGEKLHESLFAGDEAHQPTNHPKIMRFVHAPLSLADVDSFLHHVSSAIASRSAVDWRLLAHNNAKKIVNK